MMRGFSTLVRRDLRLAARIGGGVELGLAFFLILVSIVPFALGPDQNLLGRLAPAILWLAALLATLLGLDRLFQADEDEGAIDQLILSDLPLEFAVLAKVLAHWLATGLPLAILSPLFGLMLNLEPANALPLIATLLVGTPALTLIGAVGAALTVSLRRGGLLLSVLVLPLAVPVLIFGVAAADQGTASKPAFTILCGLSLIMLVIAPIACAAALRQVRE